MEYSLYLCHVIAWVPHVSKVTNEEIHFVTIGVSCWNNDNLLLLLNNIRWLNIKMRLTTFSQRLFFWFDHKLQPTLKAICNFNPWALWKWSKKILNPWKKGKKNKREIFQIHLNIFFSRIFSIKKNESTVLFHFFFLKISLPSIHVHSNLLWKSIKS